MVSAGHMSQTPEIQETEAPSGTADGKTAFIERTRDVTERVGWRAFRLFGEIVAILIALFILVFFITSQMLTRQSVDLSLIRPNIALWFSQSFEGKSAEVGPINLQWLPARNAVRFTARDITVFDDAGRPLQTVAQLQATTTLSDLRERRAQFQNVDIVGGEVTWLQRENGDVTAGLGRPETVGLLGPVYRGRTDEADPPRVGWLNAFERVRLRESTAYIINEFNGLDIDIDVDEMRTWRADDGVSLSFQGIVNKDDKPAGQFDLQLEADPDLQRFNVEVSTQGLKLDALAPERGRYEALSTINPPLDLSISAAYSRSEGLSYANLNLKGGNGSVTVAGEPRAIQSLSFIGELDPGEQVMTVEAVTLDSDILRFEGSGFLRDIGRLYDGDIGTSPFFDLDLSNVSVDATPTLERVTNIRHASVIGELDLDERRLRLDELEADFGEFALSATFDVQATQDGFERLIAEGRSRTPMSRDDLLLLWPVSFADGARRWLENSVEGGQVDQLSFSANLDPDFFEDEELTSERLQVDFAISDGLVRYISTMTPLSSARATGQIDGNSLSLTLDEGAIGDVPITSGQVDIPRLIPKGGDILISAQAEAEIEALMRLINQPPFRYMDRYGVAPDGFEGIGDVELRIKRPLLEYFDEDRIEYDVSGAFSDASAPFELGDFRLHSADLTIEGGKEGLFLEGPANIGPWRANVHWAERYGQNGEPTRYRLVGTMDRETMDRLGIGGRGFFSGEVDVDIEAEGKGLNVDRGTLKIDARKADLALSDLWLKPIGEPAQFSAGLALDETGVTLSPIAADASGLNIAGGVHLGSDFSLIQANADRLEISDIIDGSLRMDRDPDDDRLRIRAEGDSLNISTFVDQAIEDRSGASGSLPLIIEAKFDRLVLDESYDLNNAAFAYNKRANSEPVIRLTGSRPDGRFDVGLREGAPSHPDDPAFQRLEIEVPDLSMASAAFLGLRATRGGAMNLVADIPTDEQSGPWIGSVEVTDFNVQNAPFLAQILSLASLPGLFDTLGGEGLNFDVLNFDFSLRDGSLAFRDATMHGPALGMTGEGDINLTRRLVDANGTLVPSYTANSLLGDIPVFGDLLIGGEGEGVFAVTYFVNGPFSGAQVGINPLSALTPGFLRGIFGVERDDLPEMPDMPDAPEVPAEPDEATEAPE